MVAAAMATLHATLWAHCRTAATQIAEESGNANTTTSGLQGCSAPLVDLLRRQAAQLLRLDGEGGQKRTALLVARRLDDLVELAHARFYAYAPSDVPACWRHLYTDASILLFALRWWCQRDQRQELTDDHLDDLVRPLDLALILAGGAGPPSRGRAWIHEALDLLHCILEESQEEKEEEDQPQRKRPRLDVADSGLRRHPAVPDFSAGPMFSEDDAEGITRAFIPPVRHPIPRSGPLGLEAFQAYLDRDRGTSRQPLVMSGMLDHWPARQPDARPWSSPAYLRWRTLRGRRLVPVEVGRSYVDAGWTQAVVPFGEVLDNLGRSEGRPQSTNPSEKRLQPDTRKPGTGPMYLAQHALFTQMPWLQNDISIPDACYTATGVNEDDSEAYSDDGGGDVLLNAWLGPPGTITPLHTDPHHNLLAQVVGRKYVRLYAPEHTAALRPRGCEAGGVDMGNTSRVDVGAMEGWDVVEGGDEDDDVDEDEKQRFPTVPYVDCILAPGDTLYIPQGWWHYVRGLSVSFSVSFWWN